MTATPQPPLPPAQISRRRLLAGTSAVVGGTLLSAALPEAIVDAASVPPHASRYVPLTPFRVLDTRRGIKRPGRPVGSNRVRVALGGYTDPGSGQRIDAAASAVVVTVTAVNGAALNHVQAFPSDLATPPRVAVMNLRAPGQVISNMVTTRLSDRGEFDISSPNAAEIIVDVVGYYKPVKRPTSAGRYVPIRPVRVHDSRRGGRRPSDGGSVLVDVTEWTSPDAIAVVINLGAVLPDGPGHVSAVPAWQRDTPTTATLNLKFAGDAVSGSAIVPLRTRKGRRKIRVYAHRSCHVIVDVSGYFTGRGAPASTDGLFVPLTPQRILDTRGMWPKQLGRLGRLWHAWTVEAPVTNHAEISKRTAKRIGAVAVNLTAFESRAFPAAGGHFTLSAAGLPVPGTASLNWSQPGSYASNHVISNISDAGLQIYTANGAAATIDLSGYFLGKRKYAQIFAASPAERTPPPIPPTWKLQIPSLWDSSSATSGRWQTVIAHSDGTAAIDSGNLWHWTNTGNMLDRDVFIFGHRTDAGGPLRNVHLLQTGSPMLIDTSDGRRYTFRYVGMDLTRGDGESVFGVARGYRGNTVSLVSCTAGPGVPGKKWYEPTSVNWRLVSTFEFVDWQVIDT